MLLPQTGRLLKEISQLRWMLQTALLSTLLLLLPAMTSGLWNCAEAEKIRIYNPFIDLTSINDNLLPTTTCTYDIGSSTLLWKDAYFNGTLTATAVGIGITVPIKPLHVNAPAVNNSAVLITDGLAVARVVVDTEAGVVPDIAAAVELLGAGPIAVVVLGAEIARCRT